MSFSIIANNRFSQQHILKKSIYKYSVVLFFLVFKLKEAEQAEFIKEQETQNIENRDYPYYDHYLPYRKPRPVYSAQQLITTTKPTYETYTGTF